MGLFKKVFKPVRKIAKKIIPKEVRPFLPYIAAGFGPAGLAGTKFATMNPAFQKAILAGVTSAATDEQGNPLRAAALAAAPDVISGGLGNVAGRIDPNLIADSDSFVQVGDMAAKTAGALSRASEGIKGAGALKTIGAQTALDQSAKFAEIRQDEIDEYNRSLQEQGVLDKTKRRTAIFNIYKNAGYEDDYVNSMLDRYGYDNGGEVKDIPGKGKKTGIEKILEKLNEKKDDDEDTSKNLAGGLMAAAEGVEKAFGRGFGEVEPVPMLRFARGGEVEIEEQVDDLGIMDLMKDQGIQYGEQASAPNNFAELNMLAIDLFGRPYDQLSDGEQETLMDFIGSKSQAGGEGIMQMASGYKSDIEEMYEQYVFEMEEQGLEPMDFASFLRQARSGMANGGRVGFTKGGDVMRGVNRGIDPLEVLDILEEFKRIKEKYGYEMSFDDYLDGEVFADGGKVKRRKKSEPADEVIETEEEIFLDKMPRPKRKGIMEVASGGIMNKNLLNTGMDKDMRGGGFIPEGTKEKADDVPARLSKNEFVMTADAVRAAGGGSVNKGAKRMYDLMYTLEAKV